MSGADFTETGLTKPDFRSDITYNLTLWTCVLYYHPICYHLLTSYQFSQWETTYTWMLSWGYNETEKFPSPGDVTVISVCVSDVGIIIKSHHKALGRPVCACGRQRGRSDILLYYSLSYSFDTRVTNWTWSQVGSQPSSRNPLHPPQHWVTGLHIAFSVDSEIGTQGHMLGKQTL